MLHSLRSRTPEAHSDDGYNPPPCRQSSLQCLVWDCDAANLEVVGVTSQVSDVAVTSRRIRRTVSAHGVISFLFNVAVVALTVNIAASAI
jgi:hypothetical protein